MHHVEEEFDEGGTVENQESSGPDHPSNRRSNNDKSVRQSNDFGSENSRKKKRDSQEREETSSKKLTDMDVNSLGGPPRVS